MNENDQGVEADQSPSLAALAGALAKAQGLMAGAKKDNLNPHFKSKYADLASVWEACREALSVNGLAVIQLPGTAGKDVLITTLLVHASGEWIRSRYTMPVTGPGPQGVGSALTYARRYSLAAMVGVAPEDDDGNAASGPPKGGAWNKESVLPPAAPATGKRTSEIKAQLAQRRIVEVKEGETEKEAEKRSATHWFEKIRDLGKLQGLEGKRLASAVRAVVPGKTEPEKFTEADYQVVAAALQAVPGAFGPPPDDVPPGIDDQDAPWNREAK